MSKWIANLYNHPSESKVVLINTQVAIGAIQRNEPLAVCIHRDGGDLHGTIRKQDGIEASMSMNIRDLLHLHINQAVDAEPSEAIQEIHFREAGMSVFGIAQALELADFS